MNVEERIRQFCKENYLHQIITKTQIMSVMHGFVSSDPQISLTVDTPGLL